MGQESLISNRRGLGGGFGHRPQWTSLLFGAAKESIVADIEAKVAGTSYSTWRIGLTHDIAQRKSKWSETELCSAWKAWLALSLRDAQDIEALFIRKGMKGGTGGSLENNKLVYVYIF